MVRRRRGAAAVDMAAVVRGSKPRKVTHKSRLAAGSAAFPEPLARPGQHIKSFLHVRLAAPALEVPLVAASRVVVDATGIAVPAPRTPRRPAAFVFVSERCSAPDASAGP